jgi:hypothetical protein
MRGEIRDIVWNNEVFTILTFLYSLDKFVLAFIINKKNSDFWSDFNADFRSN